MGVLSARRMENAIWSESGFGFGRRAEVAVLLVFEPSARAIITP